ncbi:MAG: hypothetical protein N2044_07965 [Cyclobacteriaceae bacterium]|nr:hypothetical protein [Cyclobacteriaceae bacterium]
MRSLILAVAAIVVLLSFTVVSVRRHKQAPVSKQERQGPVYRTEPLGGFVAEDRL